MPTPFAIESAPIITIDTLPYTYAYISVSTASAKTLIPNFSEKSDTKTIMTKNGCDEAING